MARQSCKSNPPIPTSTISSLESITLASWHGRWCSLRPPAECFSIDSVRRIRVQVSRNLHSFWHRRAIATSRERHTVAGKCWHTHCILRIHCHRSASCRMKGMLSLNHKLVLHLFLLHLCEHDSCQERASPSKKSSGQHPQRPNAGDRKPGGNH